MTPQRRLKLACSTACALCLAAGFALAGKWVGAGLAGLVWLGWLFAAGWPPSILLTASVALAAGGVWAGAPPLLMLPAATLALAGWDVARWEAFLDGASPAVAARSSRRHYACLALALGPALLVAWAGGLVHFQLPFAVLVFLVALALLGLNRLWGLIKG